MIMVRHFQEEEALPALPDLPKAVKVASYFILECEVALYVRRMLEHNCTIFLCSLDVRNIVQGGDPLYAGFFSTQGSGGYT